MSEEDFDLWDMTFGDRRNAGRNGRDKMETGLQPTVPEPGPAEIFEKNLVAEMAPVIEAAHAIEAAPVPAADTAPSVAPVETAPSVAAAEAAPAVAAVDTAPIAAAAVEPTVAATDTIADTVSASDTDFVSIVDAPAGERRRLHMPHLPFPHLRRGHDAGSAEDAPARRGSLVVTIVGAVLAFALGAALVLGLFAAAVTFINSNYGDTVAPGVTVGKIDASGLTRDELEARIRKDYAYVSEGKVVVTTPNGTATLTFADLGRVVDADFMAGEAMWIGHSGNTLEDAVNIVRAGINHRNVALQVHLDPDAVTKTVRKLLDSSRVYPTDATVTNTKGKFTTTSGVDGHEIDEQAIAAAIIEHLSQPDATSTFEVGPALISLTPDVTEAEAQEAIAQAEKMCVDTTLTWTPAAVIPGSSPSLASVPAASVKPGDIKTFSVDAATVRTWIIIGRRTDGTFGPSMNTAMIEAYLEPFKAKVGTKPVEPKVVWDGSGKPSALKGGKDGTSIDVPKSAQALAAYLLGVGAGSPKGDGLVLIPGPVLPKINGESIKGLVIIGQWQTIYYPGESNGFGVNIIRPAELINGTIVAAGAKFNFLYQAGPINKANGYTLGGVISHGHSDFTGAMGGGICSASTTFFNAALQAGLEINERHAHYYYIDRYPIGLDATVFSNGYQTFNMIWTNDTPNPIVIRASIYKASKSRLTVQLWSQPTGRTVSFNKAKMEGIVAATNKTVYSTTLKPGQQAWAEHAAPGFHTTRTRTVKDADGNVIHQDTWTSKYVKVDGLLVIGVAPSKTGPVLPPSGLSAADQSAAGDLSADGVATSDGGIYPALWSPPAAVDTAEGIIPARPSVTSGGRRRTSRIS